MDLSKVDDAAVRLAKLAKIRYKILALEGYRGNVRQALQSLEDAKRTYRGAHGSYTGSWQGDTRRAYEEMALELNHTGNRANHTGEELLRALNREISSLHSEERALK
ncbi:hypothetical protein J7E71_25945 [Mesobacillus foraminis]|uniref:hypothetical protein n=1 Tax=Mesobacillus foraminis TaxID=279826 RepID=UPI001BE87358|nr:hypothetical protein [Mesobacillus foraminis]MBT2759314.1 hypothetical protein [Mesobacillus foraminis]